MSPTVDQAEQILEFAAPHELIIARQAQTMLGSPADDMLDRLARARLLRRVRLAKQMPLGYSIAMDGLTAIESDLPAPHARFAGWRHALGVSWLWVSIRKGVYGPVQAIWTRRELVARDVAAAKAGRTSRPAGVRVGGVAADNEAGVHHPDLLVVTDTRHWVAFYLLLGFPARRQLAATLTAYGADARFDAVLVLVEDLRVGLVVEEETATLGLSELVRVQHFTWRR